MSGVTAVFNRPTFLVKDVKPVGANGQPIYTGIWNKRDLNTIYENTLVGASLNNSIITLPPGLRHWDIDITAFQTNNYFCVLWDITNGKDLDVSDRGNSHMSGYAATKVRMQSSAILQSKIDCVVYMTSITTASVIGGGGDGRTSGTAGASRPNIFTTARFW